MPSISNTAIMWISIVVGAIVLIACYKLLLRLFGVIIVPEDSIGIVNKRFVIFGANKTLPDGEVVAMKGEAGLQADTLPPGLHFLYWPWQYTIRFQGFITIDDDKIGIVEARGGNALTNGRVLAKQVDCDSFQDVRKFLGNGGQRGPQIAVIPPGTYRINTEFFSINPASVLEIEDNKVGIVTVKDGEPLTTGEIAGKEIAGHNMFQEGEKFIIAGGHRGLQEQVLLAGRYFINPRFATVDTVDMTTVPIANVGVVIAYVGETGVDVTGDHFKHGNMVKKGQKGVWVDPLDPGKYAINILTHKVEAVPTANIVLNWANGKTEAHNLDKNLSTITVRSADGFTFNLDVSQIIHIPRADAPKVIARFGSVANLVTQVLEPTIGNYFRNTAQNSDVIDFLKHRTARQEEARAAIAKALQEYNVVAVDTLIGDINPPAELMKTLTDRKIAEQAKVTYDTQKLAQVTRQELEEATARANTQARVVDAERQVAIKTFEANANIEQAKGTAAAKRVEADAEGYRVTTIGNAEGGKIEVIGLAEAKVTKAKIDSMEANNYAAIKVAEALAGAGIKLVPDVMVVGGNGSNGGGTLVDVLLANTIRDQLTRAASKTEAEKTTTTVEPGKPASK